MNIRAYIEIKLENNEVITYVNSTTQDSLGKSGQYYSYTNETGDTYDDQAGAGKVLGDFTTLSAQLGTTGALTWPDPIGGTVLIRPNANQNKASAAKIRRTVLIEKIVSINVIEMEINEFQQLEYERSLV